MREEEEGVVGPMGLGGKRIPGSPMCPRAGAGYKRRGMRRVTQFAALAPHPSFSLIPPYLAAKLMASNYVDTSGEEGRFERHHSTTPTAAAAAASPRTMRRSWSSASSAYSSHGGPSTAPKCVCAPATHAGSFKCRLHRTNSHGHNHHPSTPPSLAAPAAPPPAVSSSSRTVEAQ